LEIGRINLLSLVHGIFTHKACASFGNATLGG
jgi:hypothetical protein